jgi:hypothetical protein
MIMIVWMSVRLGMVVRWSAGRALRAQKKAALGGLEWPERVLRKPYKGVQAGAPT